MNLTAKGEISAMLPALQYDRYPQWIIRPLSWVTERETDAYAKAIGFEAVRCRCGYDTTSRRKHVRSLLEAIIESEGEQVRKRLMLALHNIRADYMPLFAEETGGGRPGHTWRDRQ
jgi:tRNA(Ile)-lysidine synthase TilS/MesJ